MQQIPSLFTKYELSPEELRVAVMISPLTRAWLETMRATYAEERVTLVYNIKDPEESVQKDAELKGMIGVISFILEQEEQFKN